MKISYHGKSKKIPRRVYDVKRDYRIGDTLFGYVIEVDGRDTFVAKKSADSGKTWRYVNENN